jgi:hypothetical protein
LAATTSIALAGVIRSCSTVLRSHLVPRELHAGLGLAHRSLGHLLTGADLLVVQARDHLARLVPVALAHGDLADAAGRLRGYRGIVAFDPAAHGDHARLTFRPGQEEVPHPETGEAREELVAEILISEKLPPALAPPLVESPPSSFFAFPLRKGRARSAKNS